MKRMKGNLIVNRDNLIVKYIQQHKGKDNCVSAKELAKHLQDNGYSTKSEAMHVIIRKIMYERCLPICSLNSKGYYLGGNRQDIVTSIEELQSRVRALQEHIDHLKNFIIE